MNVRACVWASFSFGFEGGMWDVIVFIPDHWLSIYFDASSWYFVNIVSFVVFIDDTRG